MRREKNISPDLIPTLDQQTYPPIPSISENSSHFKISKNPLDLAQIEISAKSEYELEIRLLCEAKDPYVVTIESDTPSYNPKIRQLFLHEFPEIEFISSAILTYAAKARLWRAIPLETLLDSNYDYKPNQESVKKGIEELEKYRLIQKINVQGVEYIITSTAFAKIIIDCEYKEVNPRIEKPLFPPSEIIYKGDLTNMPNSLSFKLRPGYVINPPEIVLYLNDFPTQIAIVTIKFQYLGELPEEDQYYGWQYGLEKPIRALIGNYVPSEDKFKYFANNIPVGVSHEIHLGDSWDSSSGKIDREPNSLFLLKIIGFDPESMVIHLSKDIHHSSDRVKS